MNIFYERTEHGNKVTIIYKYQAIYYITLIVLIALSVIVPLFSVLVAPLLFVMIIAVIIGRWKPNMEIRKAMKQGHVKVTGSRFSLRNPITFEIEN